MGRGRLLLLFLAAVSSAVGCQPRGDDDIGNEDQAFTEEYGRYLEFVANHGIRRQRDRSIVIGVRGRDLQGRLHPTRIAPVYDDTLIVLTASRDVVRLAVSTHPWEAATADDDVPDVDGDAKPDVGMLRPGTYLASRREASRDIAGAPTYQVTTSDGASALPAYRNTSGDDAFAGDELTASQTRGDQLPEVLFHRAGEGAPKALGAQVLDAESMQMLVDNAGDRFDYLLVDANESYVP